MNKSPIYKVDAFISFTEATCSPGKMGWICCCGPVTSRALITAHGRGNVEAGLGTGIHRPWVRFQSCSIRPIVFFRWGLSFEETSWAQAFTLSVFHFFLYHILMTHSRLCIRVFKSKQEMRFISTTSSFAVSTSCITSYMDLSVFIYEEW